MSTKGEKLARQFEQANAEFVSFVRELSPEQWKAECPGEGWTVGVVAHHIADDHGILADLVKTIANGGVVPVLTADFINGLNADHAQRAAGCTREETVELAQSRGAQAADMLLSLSDQQFTETAVMPLAGGEVSAEVISEMLLIGHIGMHIGSIQAAIVSPPA
jgi:hypothetical protein